MKKLALLALLATVAVGTAGAQQLDAAFGVTTVTSPELSTATAEHFPQRLGGGAYPAFSANYLWPNHLGFGGEVAFRAKSNLYTGFQPYRPILFSFNAVYAPPIGTRFQPEINAGIGMQSVRFYTPFFECDFTGCTNYQSSNHFLTKVGGGLRFYVSEKIFVRPEAHAYFVRNNLEFSSPRVMRYGFSIGYTLRTEEP